MPISSAQLYDEIYDWKNYQFECEALWSFLSQVRAKPATSLLDVACGTGKHISMLQHRFKEIEGIDLNPEFIEVARTRNPAVTFHIGDMVSFDLGKQFDVVTCLFSAIGYVKKVERMREAVSRMAAHVSPGGVLVLEPWFTPDTYNAGLLHAVFVNKPELKVARMNISKIEDGMTILDFKLMVGTTDGITTLEERHELGLFSHAQYSEALAQTGLSVSFDPIGLMDRGLYICVKAA